MVREVLTYETPTQLYRTDSVFRQYFQDCLHITATGSLKRGLRESMRFVRWIDAPLMSFSELFNSISGEKWASSKAQLKHFLQLSDVLGQVWNNAEPEKYSLIHSMEKNQLELLKTLRMLAELGISSMNLAAVLKGINKGEKFFLEIMEEMEEGFIVDLEKLETFLEDSNLSKILEDWHKEIKSLGGIHTYKKSKESNLPLGKEKEVINGSLTKKKIILHGFYFITPIQEKIFTALEKKYDLIFLNCYNKNFPETFDSVEFFLNLKECKSTRVIEEIAKVHPVAAKLLNRLEGDFSEEEAPQVTEYTDIIQFIKAEREKVAQEESPYDDDIYLDFKAEFQENLITPRAKEIEEYLIASGIAQVSNRKLTDYPVGQFLYHLHSLRRKRSDFASGEIIFEERLTIDLVKDCFSSGCLIINGENMKEHLKSLEYLAPLMEGASTFNEWEKRFKFLRREKEYWESEVVKENPLALENPLHKFHSFPMNQLSYFSLSMMEINHLMAGIGALKDIHDTLFTGWENKKIRLEEHFEKLEKLVFSNVEAQFEDEERNIVQSLVREMKGLKDEELEFSMKDIASGLQFFLSGELNEQKRDENFENMVGLESADGTPFLSIKNIHLAFADQEALPLGQDYNVWPLTDKSLEYIEIHYSELRLLKERKKRNRSITRYLLYILFASANDIRFSYVKNLGRSSSLRQTIYFDLLDCKVIPYDLGEHEDNEIEIDNKNKKVSLINSWPETFVREAKICPKRASFSYILNKQPTFLSEFHHEFLYGNFQTLLHRVMKSAKAEKNLEDRIDSWFPQWNDLKKDLNKNYVFINYPDRGIGRGPILIEGKSYSKGLNYFHLLPTSYAKFDKNKLYKDEEINLNSPRPGNHCMYCPHLNKCKEGRYAIDKEK